MKEVDGCVWMLLPVLCDDDGDGVAVYRRERIDVCEAFLTEGRRG